jgi:hemolysin III
MDPASVAEPPDSIPKSPPLDGAVPAVPAAEEPKPRLRGRFHQAAFLVSVPAGLALVAVAPTTVARWAAVVFALSLTALYGTSAAYHRLTWSPRAHRWMKRLDHSMIFMLIAGTYTPFSLLVLPWPWSVVMLSVASVGAAAGIVMKMVRIDGLGAVTGTLYVALGWLAIVALPHILRGLSGVAVGLLFSGGALYTAGAVVLARGRPNPRPSTFGYHEIWHSMVIGGSLCHYALVFLIVVGIR